MRSSILTLVLISLPAVACPSSDDGGTGETGGSTSTAGTDTTNATSSTTINPTTSITATSGTDSGGTTDGGSTTSGVDGSSSESGGMCELSMKGAYTECIGGAMPLGGFCPNGGCLTITGMIEYEVCNRGCTSLCNCWAPPDQALGEYTAEVTCDNFDFPGSECEKVGANCSCFLDCGDGKTCPPGAECVGLSGGSSICAFQVEAVATDSGSDSGSGSGSSSDSGSESGTGSTT